jgi:hypothetical protein
MFNLSLTILALLAPAVEAINVDLGKDLTAGVVNTSGKFVAGLIDTVAGPP